MMVAAVAMVVAVMVVVVVMVMAVCTVVTNAEHALVNLRRFRCNSPERER